MAECYDNDVNDVTAPHVFNSTSKRKNLVGKCLSYPVNRIGDFAD